MLVRIIKRNDSSIVYGSIAPAKIIKCDDGGVVLRHIRVFRFIISV